MVFPKDFDRETLKKGLRACRRTEARLNAIDDESLSDGILNAHFRYTEFNLTGFRRRYVIHRVQTRPDVNISLRREKNIQTVVTRPIKSRHKQRSASWGEKIQRAQWVTTEP